MFDDYVLGSSGLAFPFELRARRLIVEMNNGRGHAPNVHDETSKAGSELTAGARVDRHIGTRATGGPKVRRDRS